MKRNTQYAKLDSNGEQTIVDYIRKYGFRNAAKHFGVSRGTLYKWAKDHGYVTPSPRRAPNDKNARQINAIAVGKDVVGKRPKKPLSDSKAPLRTNSSEKPKNATKNQPPLTVGTKVKDDVTQNALSESEYRELKDYETRIAAGWNAFVDVGKAFAAIRDRKLYRDRYTTFESYCGVD